MKTLLPALIISAALMIAATAEKMSLTNNAQLGWIDSSSGGVTNYAKVICLYDAGVSADNLYRIVNDGRPLAILAPVSVKEIISSTNIEFRTNYSQQLIQSGELCKIVGHAWRDHTHVTLEYAPNRIDCRKCGVCKFHQERYATEWK